MRRRELRLRECPTDIKIMIRLLVWSLPNNFWPNGICSESLGTHFGLCLTGLKLSEYATDIEVIMKEVIGAAFGRYQIHPVFKRLLMQRIYFASWKAKTEGMSYRNENHDKTPCLVSSQQLLTKRDLQWLVRDVIWMRHWHQRFHETSDLSCVREQLNNSSFRKLIIERIRYAS